ncbi:MAG TPA: hypothetical protein VLJ60_11730 [bacterium]|nr:hypothetical protein [bacterium]
MNSDNMKWEKMLKDVMVEGKKIKKRNTLVKTFSGISFVILLAVSVFITTYKDSDINRNDLMATDQFGNEIEVALVAADAFFDEDLEMLIY